MSKRTRLSEVTNPQGRVDVALYRIADRVMMRLETQQGLTGLRENFLPIIERAIVQNIPAENLIPPEIQAVLSVLNQGRRTA